MDIILQHLEHRINIDGRDLDLWSWYKRDMETYRETYTRIATELKKHLLIDGFDYGDLISHFMFVHDYYFQHAPSMPPIFTYLDILDEAKGKKNSVAINDFFRDTFKKCIRLVEKKKDVRFRITKEEYAERKTRFLYESPLCIRSLLKTRIFLRYLIGLIRKGLLRTNKKEADVVLLTNIRFSAKRPEDNSMFGQLILELNKERITNKVLRYEPLSQTVNLKRFVKEFMFDKEAYIGDYYTLAHFLRCNRDMKKLSRRWKEIKEKEEIKKIFVYKGYNFYDIIKPRLELMFNSLNYIACDNKNITESIIKKENYRVAVLDHEENMYGKGLILNAQHTDKKTVALSHELIAPGCVHTHVADTSVQDKRSPLWRPSPDRKFVWGPYSKKILTETCNYLPGLIKITGNPKFDFIFNTKYDTKKILKRYGLSNKKKILIASQRNRSIYQNYRKIAEQNKEYEVLLKPHPNEDEEYLRSYFKNKPQNFKLISKDVNIYELIHISDYLITYTSTVGFEAMLMNKIVFIYNPDKEKLLYLPYTQSGAAIEINRVEQIPGFLKKLSNSGYKRKLKKKMALFTKQIHPQQDGKASKRIVIEIKKMTGLN